MQMDIQLDANAVLPPVLQNRKPAAPRDRRNEKSPFTAEDRIPDMSNRMIS
jgi:hypothetical protein